MMINKHKRLFCFYQSVISAAGLITTNIKVATLSAFSSIRAFFAEAHVIGH